MNFLLRNRFFPVLLSLSFLACNPASRETVTEMQFTVDSALVDLPVQDTSLDISYRVPSDWTNIKPEGDSVQQATAGNLRISEMRKHPASEVVFALTDVRNVPDSIFRNLDDNFKTVLNPNGAWTDIQRATFRHAGYDVKQYVMSKQGQTFFKMLFGNRQRPAFQIDYSVVIDSLYEQHTKTLESIIGSLHADH